MFAGMWDVDLQNAVLARTFNFHYNLGHFLKVLQCRFENLPIFSSSSSYVENFTLKHLLPFHFFQKFQRYLSFLKIHLFWKKEAKFG